MAIAAGSFAVKPTLSGDLVTLRPLTVEYLDGLVELVDGDAESNKLTGTRATFSRAQLADWASTRADQPDRLDLAVIENATAQYVGDVVLNELDIENRSCNFRIGLIGPREFGRGFGTEATRLIIEHAFTTTDLHRIELEVYDFNPRARHVYEKVGFVYEGTKRHALRWDGEWVDAHLMSILSDEWPRVPETQ